MSGVQFSLCPVVGGFSDLRSYTACSAWNKRIHEPENAARLMDLKRRAVVLTQEGAKPACSK